MRSTAASITAAVSGRMAPRRAVHTAGTKQRAVAAAAEPTQGQVDRGHGAKGAAGWKEAGLISKTQLEPDFESMLLTYGELVQAGYDNLVWDNCQQRYGDTKDPAAQAATSLLSYLTNEYSTVPNRCSPKPVVAPAQGTADKYKLAQAPPELKLSPLIRALPGQGRAPDIKKPEPGRLPSWLWQNRSRLVDFLVYSTGGIAVRALFDKRQLFQDNERTGGRGLDPRSTFIGYVAVSQPSKESSEVDIAFIWRGTIFREEWINNFAFDRLVKWDPDTWEALDASGDGPPTPAPWEVGVHAGFKDLYLRPCSQQEGQLEADVPLEDERSPREVVHEWLRYLFEHNKVTTVSTSGHSLGGALCTLSAFDIAQEVDRIFKQPIPAGWKTQAKPAVTAFAWASPRVGNYSFLKEFSDKLGARNLRICNRKDPVPTVPGFWVQLLTFLADKVGLNVYADMDSGAGRAFAWLYYLSCSLFARLGISSKWGYTHVGQILEVDSGTLLNTQVADGSKVTATSPHNLELYIYLLSRLTRGETSRNFFLLNKTDTMVGDKVSDPSHPVDWWRAKANRGMALDGDGRWDFQPQPKKAAPVVSTAGASTVKAQP
ncbi:phospholipase A1 [Chlorella sorokiniana]|jgi:hypothetical protein|uniref:Phospholipase A1 n=1 Tax=Chlorella sorokiniana TaxID=3076 RepID=A0A2P6TJH0_CHLSO|nr:phospholipase A1 [Chlorella sorokiniana]|eukprot:PRW39379.1 phospholipase A1 [Chlorella sorokiniana]